MFRKNPNLKETKNIRSGKLLWKRPIAKTYQKSPGQWVERGGVGDVLKISKDDLKISNIIDTCIECKKQTKYSELKNARGTPATTNKHKIRLAIGHWCVRSFFTVPCSLFPRFFQSLTVRARPPLGPSDPTTPHSAKSRSDFSSLCPPKARFFRFLDGPKRHRKNNDFSTRHKIIKIHE